MFSQRNLFRFGAALGIAATVAIATSPTRSAMAQDRYEDDGVSIFGITDVSNSDVKGVVAGFVGAGALNLFGAFTATGAVAGDAGAMAQFGNGGTDLVVARKNDARKPLLDTAEARGFTRIAQLIDRAELETTFRSQGPLTVFWPTDSVVAGLPTGTTEALEANPAKLREFIKDHAVTGSYSIAALKALPEGKTLRTLSGKAVGLSNDSGTLTVDGVPVVGEDIPATNGVIHPIEGTISL